MTTEVRLFSPTGEPQADINVVPTASHIVNDIGDCSFDISTEDFNAVEDNLRPGRILLINDDLITSWVGFIDTASALDWGAGKITIRALSAENVFNNRIIFPQRMRGTAGAVLKQMLENIQNDSDGGVKIYPGDVFMGGKETYYPLLGRAWDVMNFLADIGKCDWSVTHDIVNGKLILLTNLYEGERGVDTGLTLDASNTELYEPIYSEQGDIWNHVVFATPLSSTGAIKIGGAWRDEESIALYGLKMYLGESESDGEDATAQDNAARAWLYDHAYPGGMIMPNILNIGDTFPNVQLGNIFGWENHAVKFKSSMPNDKFRITGFEVNYDDYKIGATMVTTKKPFDIKSLFNE